MRKLTTEEIAARRLTLETTTGPDRLPICGLLDNIRSLYNVGSIFRTSDGGRISKLYLCGYTPHPPRKEIDKTSLGAVQSVLWEYHKDPLDAIAAIKSQGIKLCVLEQTTVSRPYFDLTRRDFPICLVVGNEIGGVSSRIIAKADMAIEIPMLGSKHSLNAAVAYGIALYELVRIWRHRTT